MASQSLGEAVLELTTDNTGLGKGLAAARSGSVKEMIAAAKESKLAVAGIIGGAVVGLGASLYKVGSAFDDAFDTIQTGTGATGKKLAGLQGDFRAVVKDVPASFGDAADAITDVSRRLGLTGKPLQERTKQFLELSRITGTDVKTNIEAVSKALVDAGVPVKEQGKVLDGFFRVSQKTGISVADLAKRCQEFGSPLRQLGFTLPQTAAMFGTFEKAGVNTATMVPGLKMALSNLTKPTSNLGKEMKDLGIKAGDPKKALEQVFSILSDKGIPAAKKTGLAMDVFGKRAGADMAEAVRQGRFNFQGLVDVFNKGRGTIIGTGKDTSDFAESLQLLKNRAMLALEPVATQVFSGLGQLASVMVTLTNGAKGLPGPILQIVGALIGAAGLFFALNKAKAAFMALRALMLANPYLLLIAATVALVVLIVKNWDTIKGAITAAWSAIKSAVGAAISAVMSVVTGAWSALSKATTAVWNAIKAAVGAVLAAVKAAVVAYFNAYKTVITTAWNAIKSATTGAWNAIKSTVSDAYEAIKSGITSTWNAVKSATTGAWNAIKSAVSTGIGAVVGFIKGLPGKAKDAASGMVGKLGDVGHDAINALKNGISGGVEALKRLVGDIPGKVKGALGSVSGLLYDAGKAIIQGLINGIGAMLGSLFSKVKGIAGKIKSLKGPLPKDRVLLVEEGQAIIQGLGRGMSSEFSRLEGDISRFAPQIKATITGSAGSSGSTSTVGNMVNIEHMEVHDAFDERKLASDLAWRVVSA